MLSEDQILSLAPDESSKKSGRELASAAKWVRREVGTRALWGECQGSGKKPYQTQVDLTNIAFKCTCPSRKFPCKHGLGLMLLYTRDKKGFAEAAEPAWVQEWLDKRLEREEKKVEAKERDKEKPADPIAQAKREENRVRRIESGIADLRLWVNDLVRNGLANIPAKDPGYFETMAKRLVDAQAGGLAGMVRSLAGINFYQDGWQNLFLDQLVRIYLVLEGFSRLDNHPASLQEEIKSLIGYTQNQEALRNSDGTRDDWFVLAKRTEKEDNLTIERNWLYGLNSKRYALVLQFYVGSQLPEVNLVPGTCLDAELVYFKGVSPIRALIRQQHGVKPQPHINGYGNWTEALTAAGERYAVNPWLNELPVIIDQIVPQRIGNDWVLKDNTGKGVRITPGFVQPWQLLAVSGGEPVNIFALGREHSFEPMGVWTRDHYIIFE